LLARPAGGSTGRDAASLDDRAGLEAGAVREGYARESRTVRALLARPGMMTVSPPPRNHDAETAHTRYRVSSRGDAQRAAPVPAKRLRRSAQDGGRGVFDDGTLRTVATAPYAIPTRGGELSVKGDLPASGAPLVPQGEEPRECTGTRQIPRTPISPERSSLVPPGDRLNIWFRLDSEPDAAGRWPSLFCILYP